MYSVSFYFYFDRELQLTRSKEEDCIDILLLFNALNKVFGKVNSVQEGCAKFFAVHLLKFEILQITWKKKHQIWWKTKN